MASTSTKTIPHKIGFIGAGNMAKSIGSALLDSGLLPVDNLIVSAPSDKNLEFWRNKGVRTTNDNVTVITKAEIIFIAVKPQYFHDMVSVLKETSELTIKRCFVSIMAGKTLENISQELERVSWIHPLEIIKVMPNTPSMIGAGCSVMTSISKGSYTAVVKQIMQLTGECEEIPESLMNACGALSGSGPAYMYIIMEALADGGVKLGIPRDLAYKLAAQTLVGAGRMVLETGKHPGVLKDEVCSAGGSTIAAVHELEKSGVRAAFMNALGAATARSEQLS